MAKSDKELAVEIAKAYIEASSQQKEINGISRPLIKLDSVLNVIKKTHNELSKLD